MLLAFDFSTMVSNALGIITSIISFITENNLLITLLGVSIVLSLVFAVYARLHR